jgi:hypothetical protein
MFRYLDQKILFKISYLLIEDWDFGFGDLILGQGLHNPNIVIVMEGNVQVRVGRKRASDHWLGNLRKGSCFNVYTPFIEDRKSGVNYYANS